MNRELIDLIYQYSKHYGNILHECEDLYEEGRGFILMICFFNIVENIIRSVNENFNISFKDSIQLLNSIVNIEEIQLLNEVRDIRNKYTHKDLNQYFFEKDGILYSLNEDETALKIYENYSEKIYKILTKILKNKFI